MNIKDLFLGFIECFDDMGKEVFSFLVLTMGLVLLFKGLLSGQQFTDLVKAIGVAYIGGCAVGSTSDALIAHFKCKIEQVVKEKE